MTYNKGYDPIHPLIFSPNVSNVHKADYMKAYILHHFGGGVTGTDVFHTTSGRWEDSFAAFSNPDVWAVGVPRSQEDANSVACGGHYLRFLALQGTCDDVRKTRPRINASDALIVRAGTPMTHAWLRAANWRLDYLREELQAHPTPYKFCCKGQSEPKAKSYPLKWEDLREDLMNPLFVKYAQHIETMLPASLSSNATIVKAYKAHEQHQHRDEKPVIMPFDGPNGEVVSHGHGAGSSTVPVMVWALWFGAPMKGARLHGFATLQSSVGVPVRLVQERDLPDINKSYSPIHPAVMSGTMSAVQRGDYLRAYIMHHYGGGYSDVKPTESNWTASFQEFKDPNLWVYGVQEQGGVACGRDSFGLMGIHASCGDIVNLHASFVSNGAYIMRAGTPLTDTWLRAANQILDKKFEALKRHPAPFQRCCLGLSDEASRLYPLRWAELHGELFHPLQYKFLTHIKSGLPRWAAGAYMDTTELHHDEHDEDVLH